MNDFLKGFGIGFAFIGVGCFIFLWSISAKGCEFKNEKPAIGINGYIVDTRK